MLLEQLEWTRRPRRPGFWRSSPVLRRPYVRNSLLGASGAKESTLWQRRRVCCPFSRPPGGVVGVRFIASLLLVFWSMWTLVDLGLRPKWTDVHILERLVFLVHVRGTMLHGALVVKRSFSQSLRFGWRRGFGRFLDAIPAMLSMRGHFMKRLTQRDGCTGGLRAPVILVAQHVQRQPRGLANGT